VCVGGAAISGKGWWCDGNGGDGGGGGAGSLVRFLAPHLWPERLGHAA